MLHSNTPSQDSPRVPAHVIAQRRGNNDPLGFAREEESNLSLPAS